MNRLEELGRVDSEKAYTKKGKENLGAEKSRIVRELKKGGGMMMQRPMYKDGSKVRGDIKLGRDLVKAFGSKKTINKMKSNIQDKNRVKKMDGGRAKGLIPEAQEKAKSMTVKSSKRRVKKMGGGSLKAVPADNKGLKKLPTQVRNKMGYMKNGGRAKMKSGGLAKRGRGCEIR
jgi:hypothetical protein